MSSLLRRSLEGSVGQMRLEAATQWSSRGEISPEKAALIAGFDRAGFLDGRAGQRVDAFAVEMDDRKEEVDCG